MEKKEMAQSKKRQGRPPKDRKGQVYWLGSLMLTASACPGYKESKIILHKPEDKGTGAIPVGTVAKAQQFTRVFMPIKCVHGPSVIAANPSFSNTLFLAPFYRERIGNVPKPPDRFGIGYFQSS